MAYWVSDIHKRPQHSRPGFTLLELILVIGVLSILLAIILPILGTIHEATLKKQARIETLALAQAAIRYMSEYNFWPGMVVCRSDGEPVKLNENLDMDAIVGVILSGPETFTQITKIYARDGSLFPKLELNTNEVYRAFNTVGYPDGNGYKPNPLNPKAISFLALKGETDINTVNFLDPWGEPYRLVMGMKGGRPCEIYSESDPSLLIVAVSNVTAFAYSVGPRGGWNRAEYIFSIPVPKPNSHPQ